MGKRTKRFIVIVSIILILSGTSVFISMSKFEVINPFSVAYGLYKITFTDTEYIEIQEYPKVIITKPDNYEMINRYMENKGYSETDRLGSMIKFTNSDNDVFVHFSANKYYSLWKWSEWRRLRL